MATAFSYIFCFLGLVFMYGALSFGYGVVVSFGLFFGGLLALVAGLCERAIDATGA